MRRGGRGALAAALVLAAAVPARAQAVQNIVLRNSFNPVGAGARGLGMGGAFIAVADDGTAVSFNPAGLSQLRRSEIAVVGFGEELASTVVVRRPDGQQTRGETSRHGAPDFVGVAVPFEVGSRNLTVQLSYQRAVDLFGRGAAGFVQTAPASDLLDPELIDALRIPPDRPVEVDGDIFPAQSGAFHTATVAAGYQLTSRLSVGAALNYWIGEWNASGTQSLRYRTVLRPGQPPVDVFRFQGTFRQDQSLRALNANVGILLRYPRVSVGAVARLPFTADYDVDETFSEQDFLLGQPFAEREDAFGMRSRLHWPRSVGVGLALRPVRGLTLAGDYSRSRWSGAFIEDVPQGALLTDPPQGADEGSVVFVDRNFFDLLPATTTATADTDQWRGGAEYLLTAIPRVVVPFRAGLFRDRSPVTDLTGTVREIEGWTVGTGLNFSRLVLDVAFERRESSGVVGLRFRADQPVEGSLATETVRQDRLVASLIYRAGGPDDPLTRLFRYLFVGPRDEEE